ncbi:MAG: 3-deoxy-D-manno-octulosonic acid transferase [Sedimentisphaerales bacterium]|nr:3-deoxy-D-manno-octulosonic acid transferase [Sedimentisphaerales bacterium]
MRYLLNFLYGVAILLYSPKILYRMLRQDRYRAGWGQRLGRIGRRNPEKPCIWIHAVSVGEVNATRTLVDRFAAQMSDYEIVISSTTDTGLSRAKALYGADYEVFYFPFDLSWVMARAFRRLRPSVVLLMELEVWPNLAAIAKSQQVPVVVINGRLSDKSFPKYMKVRYFIRRMFRKVSLVLAQTDEYAQRFIALGCDADKVIVSSSLKYDTAQTDGAVEGAERLALQINLGGQRLWVAGGTGPGEEKMVLAAFARLKKQAGVDHLRLAIVPRKPERFDEVASLIDAAGFGYVRYSALKTGDDAVTGKPTVILGDTMGDLKKFYALATVVFVGRSLVPMGGSDMMEPTGLGKCTLFGPETFNFKQTVEVLLAGNGAIEVADENALYEQMLRCLQDTDFAKHIAANGQKVIRQNQGATQKTVDAIAKLIS